MIHDFQQNLEYSLGVREQLDINLLKGIIPDCTDIIKTEKKIDKKGIDYIATLRRGAKINIDAKTRRPGASKYWKYNEPELALEIWSSRPDIFNSGKTGWTLDEKSNVDYILYTYDRSDTNKFFFVPFQLLRISFVNHFEDWKSTYGVKKENNKGWDSFAVFVPASVVCKEITKLMSHEV